METDAFRYCCLSNTGHTKHCREPIVQHASYDLLHLTGATDELRDFGYFKRVSRLSLNEFILTLFERAKDAAFVLLFDFFLWL